MIARVTYRTPSGASRVVVGNLDAWDADGARIDCRWYPGPVVIVPLTADEVEEHLTLERFIEAAS